MDAIMTVAPHHGVAVVKARRVWSRSTIVLGTIAVLLPLIYLAIVMQYGALREPYWDTVAMGPPIVKWFDGTLTFADLIITHSQSRPLFPRLLYVGTAAFTRWDVAYEYIWLYLTTCGALAALLVALIKVSRDWSPNVILTTAFFIAVVFCSPVGSTNHDWSIMLMLTLSYLASIIALLMVSFRPFSWPVNIGAAVLSWIATYSIVQGLFLFPTFIVLHQLIAFAPPPRAKFVPTRWTIFWAANMAICCAVFLPGVPGSSQADSLSKVFEFCLIYTGNPIGGLLWFPELGSIDVPYLAPLNEACGVVILLLTAFTVLHSWSTMRKPATLIFLSLSIFSAANMLVTAWGRAAAGAHIGSTSRYSIYAALFIFALAFYWAPKVGRSRIVQGCVGLFLVLATVSYIRAIPVYKINRDMNEFIIKAYAPNGADTAFDLKTYPDPDYFRKVKLDLARLKIGPYR